jgi:hypothetical protein
VSLYSGSPTLSKVCKALVNPLGFSGIVINAYALYTGNTALFLLGQVIAVGSGQAFGIYLQKSISWDGILSFALGIWAAFTGDPVWMYWSMLARSINYQLVAYRFFKNENKEIENEKC